MDWLLVAVIAGGAYWIGDMLGYSSGLRDGRSLERVSRRIDEVTGTKVLKAELFDGPILQEDVDDFFGGVPPPGRKVL